MFKCLSYNSVIVSRSQVNVHHNRINMLKKLYIYNSQKEVKESSNIQCLSYNYSVIVSSYQANAHHNRIQ